MHPQWEIGTEWGGALSTATEWRRWFLFFFSSRRRHTRSLRDWSSDVCSSDLERPVAGDLGMTGEITLTGRVLPIGGLREKSLAAQRAGLKRVVFPLGNEPDLEELPADTRKALTFIQIGRASCRERVYISVVAA